MTEYRKGLWHGVLIMVVSAMIEKTFHPVQHFVNFLFN